MKINKILLLIIALFIMVNKVKADDNLKLSKIIIGDAYAVYDGEDRVHLFYGQRYALGSYTAYCIEPGVAMNTQVYASTEDLSVSGLDDKTLSDIKLLAYYGFGYDGHNTNNFYMATQELIWKRITGRNTYWVSEEDINGTKIDLTKEKNKITNAVNNHYLLPSFNNQEFEIINNASLTLSDMNQVISSYEIVSSDIENVKIVRNDLIINPQEGDKSGEIKLIKKSYTNKASLIFYNGDNQKLMSASGKLDPVIATVKINLKYNPKIKVIKVDSENNQIIKQSGIKFKIKNNDTGKYICETTDCIYETDESGTFKTDISLAYGNYQIEEIEALINNYQWNSEPLKFTIDESANYLKEDGDIYLELKFKNNPIKGKLNINKLGEKPIFKDNQIEYTKYNLDNVIFNLYANDTINDYNSTLIYKKGDLVTPIKVKNGNATLDNLYLGSYCLTEVATSDFHILNKEPYCFKIEQSDSLSKTVEVNIKLDNYLPKGTFEFTKLDSETNLPLANTKIEVYTINEELVYRGTTDNDGKIIIDSLPYGKYYYLEVLAPSGYIIDNEKYYFDITQDKEIVKSNMVNEKITVPSTSLNRSSFLNFMSLLFLLNGLGFIKNGTKNKS